MGFLLVALQRLLFPLLWPASLILIGLFGGLKWAAPMRYSLASGALLALVPPFICVTNNSLLAGLFALETTERMFFFTWMSMATALVVVSTFQAARINRIDKPRPLRAAELPAVQVSGWPMAWFLVLGLIPATCGLRMTLAEYSDVSWASSGADENIPPDAWGAYWAGITVGVLLAVLLGAYQSWLAHPDFSMLGVLPVEFRRRRAPRDDDFAPDDARARSDSPRDRSPHDLAPGDAAADAAAKSTTSPDAATRKNIPHTKSGRPARLAQLRRTTHDQQAALAPGVVLFSSLFLLFGLIYLFLMAWPHVVSARQVPGAGSLLPAIFYILLLLSLVTLLLTGAAYICDQRRVPTLLLVLLLILPAFFFPAADSYFSLAPADEKNPTAAAVPPVWESVFDPRDDAGAWKFPKMSAEQDRQATLVVVVAPGGGIQASAWTAKVLTGLDELYDGFSESVGLISSVSGGSVGAMFYLVGRGDRTNDPARPMRISPDDRDNINWQVRKSSLDAVAWALAYPKAVRPYRYFVPTDLDHGWALKTSWHLRLQQMCDGPSDADDESHKTDDRLYLRGWCDRIRTARAPAFVFNATVVETGRHLTISPLVPPSDHQGEDFLTLYHGAGPHLATASRLSAAFPYVSPSSRVPADAHPDPKGVHIVDGGYSDNEGMVTAVEWIQAVLAHRIRSGLELPFRRILIVRLQPFHVRQEETPPLRPFLSTLFGPAYAIANARSASQVERGKLEAELLIAATEAKQEELANDARLQAEEESRLHLSRLPSRIQTDLRTADGLASTKAMIRRYLPGAPAAPETAGAPAANDAVQYARPEIRAQVIADLKNKVDPRAVDQLSGTEKQEAVDYSRWQRQSQRLATLKNIPVFFLTIPFVPPQDDDQEPLSWKLTPRQERAIDAAWNGIRAEILRRPPSQTGRLISERVDDRQLTTPSDLSRFFSAGS